jgi:hypothetical protein
MTETKRSPSTSYSHGRKRPYGSTVFRRNRSAGGAVALMRKKRPSLATNTKLQRRLAQMSETELRDWVQVSIAQGMKEMDQVIYHNQWGSLDEARMNLENALALVEEIQARRR